MTDFLSRLADRAFGHVQAAQPLIAPHFAQGAEIFGPDATPFAATQTESHRYAGEQAFNAVSPDALLDTASPFVEATPSPELKREEKREFGQQALREQRPAEAISTPAPYSEIEEGVKPPSPPARAAENPPASMNERKKTGRKEEARDLSAGTEALQSEEETQHEVAQLIIKPVEVRPADEIRKDMHLPEREQIPVTSTKDSTSIENRPIQQESLISPSSLKHAVENPPASVTEREEKAPSSTRAGSPPVAPLPAGQRPQQASRAETRDLSKREQTSTGSTKNSAGLENRSIEQQKNLTPRPDSAPRQIEKPSPVLPSDARSAKQKTSDRYNDDRGEKSTGSQEPLARQAASVSEEAAIPDLVTPLEDGSGTARLVRPEKVTARARADSRSRPTTADTRPGMQTAPTIKVTIGRIEVRAVLQPAPPVQKAALPAPKMSLGDYLKSVSGERR